MSNLTLIDEGEVQDPQIASYSNLRDYTLYKSIYRLWWNLAWKGTHQVYTRVPNLALTGERGGYRSVHS